MIACSDCASSPEVGSSRMRIGALRITARAMAMRWRWPPDSVTPRSPTIVSYPSGISLMNSSALASLGGAHDLRAPGFRAAVGDVLPDRRAEQERVLQHEADLVAQRLDGEAPDVRAVDLDRPGDRVVEARDQVDDRRLAATRLADEGRDLSGLDREAEVLEHELIRRVPERHVLELDPALEAPGACARAAGPAPRSRSPGSRGCARSRRPPSTRCPSSSTGPASACTSSPGRPGRRRERPPSAASARTIRAP